MKPTILIVEDNADNRKLVEWALEDAGFDVEAVGTAEAALDALSARPFDLVLMDIALPGIDGKEGTRRIRSDPRWASLPVIAVTAHAIKGEAESILAAGVDALVTKPIEEVELLRTIRDCLGRRGSWPGS